MHAGRLSFFPLRGTPSSDSRQLSLPLIAGALRLPDFSDFWLEAKVVYLTETSLKLG